MTPNELQQEPAVQGLMRVARNACDRIEELENEVSVLKAALFQAQEAAKQLLTDHPLQVQADRDHAWKLRDTNCKCDHNEYCEKCWPPEFRKGGYWDQRLADAERVMRKQLEKKQ